MYFTEKNSVDGRNVLMIGTGEVCLAYFSLSPYGSQEGETASGGPEVRPEVRPEGRLKRRPDVRPGKT